MYVCLDEILIKKNLQIFFLKFLGNFRKKVKENLPLFELSFRKRVHECVKFFLGGIVNIRDTFLQLNNVENIIEIVENHDANPILYWWRNESVECNELR